MSKYSRICHRGHSCGLLHHVHSQNAYTIRKVNSFNGFTWTQQSFSAVAHRASEQRLDKEANETNARRTLDHLARRAREKLFDKEFFFDLLNSAATKRDAKAYISRLKSPRKIETVTPSVKHTPPAPHIEGPTHGVNLGSIFGHGRAVEDRPVFKQYQEPDVDFDQTETVHIALVKVAEPQTLDDTTLAGVAQTLSQLARLSMIPCVLIDTRPGPDETYSEKRATAARQANRMVEAIETYRGAKARRLDNLFAVSDEKSSEIFSRRMLLRLLRQGHIPVVAPIAYAHSSQQAVMLDANDALLALTKELAGLTFKPTPETTPNELAARYEILQKQVSVDRVILIDPYGVIESSGKQGKVHAFVNMEQEYEGIVKELTDNEKEETSESEQAHLRSPTSIHLQNLNLIKSVLSLLPPSSSAIITTPNEASKSSQISQKIEYVSNVGTRRQKNPLIHNLLTDKPAQSSSLPPGRLGIIDSQPQSHLTSTFIKKGMPLTLLPDPRISPWVADNHGAPRLTLNDPSIDLPRLVHLIDDSFNRKLDVDDYLSRVNSRIAGLIIAGNYEGGALLTWETPPGCSDTDTSRLVPYLDKFAVLKRAQGAGGVADIIFNAMVRGCFPNGVCWRSRKDNPVNKWYFERSKGTWKIPETNWTMFWTTPEVERESQLFRDYEGVCRGVQPSWADGKSVVD